MLKSPRTTATELISECRKLRIPLKAIVFKDELKTLNPQKGAYIINMANSNTPGTHWIGLFNTIENGKKESYYFDSYGIVPPTEIIQFANRWGDSYITRSTEQIQPVKEGFCGQFTVLFLQYMSNFKYGLDGKDRLKDFLKLFKDYKHSNI